MAQSRGRRAGVAGQEARAGGARRGLERGAIGTLRQLQPEEIAAAGLLPARDVGEMLAERGVHRLRALRVTYAQLRDERGKLAALHQLAHDVRREVVEVAAAHERAAREQRLHEVGRALDPAEAQAGGEDFREGTERE